MHVSEIRVKQIRVKQGLSVEQFFFPTWKNILFQFLDVQHF